MLDNTTLSTPDLALVLGPEDTALFIGEAVRRKSVGRETRDLVYVVVHRTAGLWTHVYRVSQGNRPGHLLVWFERFYDGDCTEEAASWAHELIARAG